MKLFDKIDRYRSLHALAVAVVLALRAGKSREDAVPPRRRWAPNTASTFGAVFYSAVGGIVSWVLIELPKHLDISWR